MSDFARKYQGLSDEEVRQSRQQHGTNVLTPIKPRATWKVFLERFLGPFGHCIKGGSDGESLIFILEIAAILSIIIAASEYFGWLGVATRNFDVFLEPIGILIAILLATCVAFYFEYRANQEFQLLRHVDDDEQVTVVRNGGMTSVARRDVVVGDVLVLNLGCEVAADARLLASNSLEVDESSLTGEPVCHKTIDVAGATTDTVFPSDCVMRGTKVVAGQGVARVYAVGDATEQGHVFVAAQINGTEKTPLANQLDRLSRYITYWSYGIALLVVVGRLMMWTLEGGSWEWTALFDYLLLTVMIAVTLIVVSVPEGLPMAVTMSLAFSMRKMLRSNNLVRKLHACETMGATTVICTDKTGTLTQNQMRVTDSRFFVPQTDGVPEEGWRQIVEESIAVNNASALDDSKGRLQVVGSPTEGALLLWLHDMGVEYDGRKQSVQVEEELIFSPENKYSAVVVRHESGMRYLYIKGAPEILLGMCDNLANEENPDKVVATLLDYQKQAKRTLGFAFKTLADNESPIVNGEVQTSQLVFLGCVGIEDSVRQEVPEAVAECLNAGIRVIIVTGDNKDTAKEVARQVGVWKDDASDENQLLTGAEMETMSDEDLLSRLSDIVVVARAKPLDKQRLVRLLQQKSEVVAVTGDGTNDAPALKLAQVGLSMGSGTSVAKEASDITILDDSFASIGRAVLWGRSLYRNIQRFLLFQLTVNVVACLVVLMGAFTGTESPLTVTQMLWVNLIMDTFAAVALASLPPSRTVMSDLPRDSRAFIITSPMWTFILSVGIVFTLLLLGVLYIMHHADICSMGDLLCPTLGIYNGLSPYELSLFFTLFVMLQFWNLFNARAFMSHQSALRLRHCKGLWLIGVIIFVGQVIIVNFGGSLFSVVPLALTDWVTIVLLTSLVLWVGETMRGLHSLFLSRETVEMRAGK